MQLALIPPVEDLNRFREYSDMHLALNHLLEIDSYFNFYKQMADEGKMVTLDNSAHENHSGDPISDLLVNAIRLKAREIVLPDTLFHSMHTVEGARTAFGFLAESPLYRACSPTPKLMVVPQGRDEEDWAWCLRSMIETAHAYGFSGLLTIGLSKDYFSYPGFPGGIDHLLRTYCRPMFEDRGIFTHLLGWTCTWDLIDWARNYSFVRSTDTAKPFIYAMHGQELTHDRVPRPISRGDNYFLYSFERESVKEQIALRNIMALRLATRGVRSEEDAIKAFP